MLYSYLTWDAEICFDITDEKREIYIIFRPTRIAAVLMLMMFNQSSFPL